MKKFEYKSDFEVDGGAITAYVFLAVIIILLFCGGWIFQSYMEMRAFNKFSDKKASLIDAMSVELRVVAQ